MNTVTDTDGGPGLDAECSGPRLAPGPLCVIGIGIQFLPDAWKWFRCLFLRIKPATTGGKISRVLLAIPVIVLLLRS